MFRAVSSSGIPPLVNEYVCGPIIGPLKFEMEEIRHLEKVKSLYVHEKSCDLMKFGTKRKI